MKPILELFSSAWAQALGWTLLHTVWQAGIITLLVIIALRFIPSRLARVRYIVATSGLVLMVVLSIGTFIFLSTSSPSPHTVPITENITKDSSPLLSLVKLQSLESDYLSVAQAYLKGYMPFIITLWIVGAFLFSIRVAGGWFYIVRIKEESTVLNDRWSDRVKELARELNIDRIVTLATSTRLQAPVVFGYIKPIILIPTGMLAGLSTDQLETIFLHELMHIRRHDYLVNLFQLWIEALLFFNPFAWILSGIIRREREYCCDDAVVTTYGNPMAYAKALAHLEEVRLNQHGLALSLAENKNQLLTRIRRIMEKSVKNYSGRERIIPVILLIAGLFCASWITISRNHEDHKSVTDEHLAAADTTIKKKERSATYSRKSIITTDEHGEPLEKIEEDFEGDEELRPLLEPKYDFRFDETFALAPPIPDFEMTLDPVMQFDFHMDSIPYPPMPPQNWDAFAEEFEKKFKENFSDFYSSHQQDFDKMMSDLEKQMKTGMSADVWAKNFETDRVRQEEFMRKHMKEMELHREEIMRHNEEAMRHQELAMERMKEDQARHAEHWQKEHDEHLKQMNEQMKKMNEEMKRMDENMKKFEKELKTQLIQDGYIKADEKINNINWDDDGTIEINGKKIKDSDRKKYDEIHNKYFKEKGNFHYVD